MFIHVWTFTQACRDAIPPEPSFWSAVWAWVAGRLLGPLVTGLVLAGLGTWWISQVNERFRSRREHASKAVDALRAQVEAVVKLGCAYWLSGYDATKSPADEAELNYRLDDIANLTRVCAAELWKSQADAGPELVSALQLAIVTDQFGIPKRKADTTRPREISEAAARITQAVTSTRHEYFGQKVGGVFDWLQQRKADRPVT